MHSYQYRIQAVDLFIKLGKRVAETIHQLGYIRWYNKKRIKIFLARVVLSII